MGNKVIKPMAAKVENMVRRAIATGKIGNKNACAKCNGELWISLFFDGTGNDQDADIPARSTSNISGLLNAHVQDRSRGYYAFYYDGVGTKFDFEDRYETHEYRGRFGKRTVEEIGYSEDGSTLGKGFGKGISIRIEKALFEMVGAIRESSLGTKIQTVHLAVFGFSRGATTARSFLHWLKEYPGITDAGSSLLFKSAEFKIDCKIELEFAGLFDTVESVGMAGTNLDRGTYPQTLPNFVKRCTHLVAAHELRHAFPLTVIGDTTAKLTTIVYPGMHSDVGGGYGQNDQYKTTDLSRIIAIEMLSHARGANLKLKSVGEMKADPVTWNEKQVFNFNPSQTAIKRFNGYLSKIKPSGTVGGDMLEHMKLYWAYMNNGYKQSWIDQHYPGSDQSFKNIGNEFSSMRSLGRLQQNQQAAEEYSNTARTAIKYLPTLSADDVAFFDTMVHDSFEGFAAIGVLQTDLTRPSYYKMRTVLKDN